MRGETISPRYGAEEGRCRIDPEPANSAESFAVHLQPRLPSAHLSMNQGGNGLFSWLMNTIAFEAWEGLPNLGRLREPNRIHAFC